MQKESPITLSSKKNFLQSVNTANEDFLAVFTSYSR